jgi:predicted kinase
MANEQHDVIELLQRAETHAGAAVERIDTHSAIVFLAGSRALKLKRAVRFDYLDFSTPQLRRAACEAEVRINRRAAPATYHGVATVTREADGSLALDGAGTPVDWLVDKTRFDQDALFDRLAARGALDLALMRRLASAVAAFHAAAPHRDDHGGLRGMTWVVDGNDEGFAQQGVGILENAAREYLAMAIDLLQAVPPRLIAIGGLSGSGKSTVALSLAPSVGAAPGALVLRSDEIRKALCGVAPLDRLGPAGYAPEVTQQVYRALAARAAIALQAGRAVIVDAVFARPADRVAIEAVASSVSVPFTGLWLDAPADVLLARTAAPRSLGRGCVRGSAAACRGYRLDVLAKRRRGAAASGRARGRTRHPFHAAVRDARPRYSPLIDVAFPRVTPTATPSRRRTTPRTRSQSISLAIPA